MKAYELYEHSDNVHAGIAGSAVAGGAGDGVAVVGSAVDTLDYLSCVLNIAHESSVSASETLSFAVSVEESDDGTSFDPAEVLLASTAVVDGDGSTVQRVTSLKVLLNAADPATGGKQRKRYLRFTVTPDLSAGATDTASFQSCAQLGGKRITTGKTSPLTA